MAIWCDSGVNERVGPADEWVCDLVHDHWCQVVTLPVLCVNTNLFGSYKDLVCRLGNGFLREQVYTIIVSTIMRI